MYELKVSQLREFENLAEQGLLDVFYADESRVCSEGYVPYGWQFPSEAVHVPVEKGFHLNLWGLLSRDNRHRWATTAHTLDARFVFEQLETFSFNLPKPTVVVLDNASVHTAQLIQKQIPYWQQRGLYLFYLPTYSPHLNVAETLWRKLKKEQIDPDDYRTKDTLCYAVNRCLAQLGNEWTIKFAAFNLN